MSCLLFKERTRPSRLDFQDHGVHIHNLLSPEGEHEFLVFPLLFHCIHQDTSLIFLCIIIVFQMIRNMINFTTLCFFKENLLSSTSSSFPVYTNIITASLVQL